MEPIYGASLIYIMQCDAYIANHLKFTFYCRRDFKAFSFSWSEPNILFLFNALFHFLTKTIEIAKQLLNPLQNSCVPPVKEPCFYKHSLTKNCVLKNKR